jgi:hypothetical protein
VEDLDPEQRRGFRPVYTISSIKKSNAINRNGFRPPHLLDSAGFFNDLRLKLVKMRAGFVASVVFHMEFRCLGRVMSGMSQVALGGVSVVGSLFLCGDKKPATRALSEGIGCGPRNLSFLDLCGDTPQNLFKRVVSV